MKSSVLPSTLLSCAVFSGLTAPLAVLGSNSINIEFQRENIFAGRLKDIATPYLGIAGLVSLGAGAVSLSVSEWRRSTRKSVRVETQLAELQKELKEKAIQIDELRLSDSHLSATGLQSFIEPDVKHPTAVHEKVVPVPPVSVSQQPLKNSLPIEQTHQSQPFRGIVETTAVEIPKPRLAVERKPEPTENPVAVVLSQVSELQNQLKQMESHIEALQSSLQTSVQPPVQSSMHPPESVNLPDSEIERLHRRLQLLELDWIRHQIAS